MTVYVDLDSDINIGVASGNSFKPNTMTKMKYSEFLEKMNENSIGVAMRDNNTAFLALSSDISNPPFMQDISEPVSIELI